MTKAKWIALGLCVFLVCGCLSHRMTGAQVMHRAQESLGETDAWHFVLEIEIDTDLLKDSLSVEIWERPPSCIRLRVLSAINPQLQGLAFATDGSKSMLYSLRTNEVTVGSSDLVKMPSVLESLIRARREWIQSTDVQETRLLAREREGGMVVYRVEAPLAQSGSAQYWIDAREWLVRRVTYQDQFLGSGSIRVQEIERLDDLPDAQFDLDFPDGATVVEISMEDSRPLTLEEAQLAVSFRIREPSYLPTGTTFLVAYQIDKNLALVYGGAQSFTLVQGASIGSVPQDKATPTAIHGLQGALVRDQAGGGMLLTWQEDELQFSIAGPLPQDELVRIAESLQ